MLKKILVITLSLVGLAFLFISPSKKDSQNVMTVGTNAEFAPFTYREGDQIVGFDIDIANEVGRRLGKKIVFRDVPFEALIPDLVLGRVEFIAAGMTATEDRAKRVAFTRPYLQGDPLVILTLKEEPFQKKSLLDFQEEPLVVNEGFTADLYLSEREGFDVVRLPTVADGFLALKNGRAKAFITAQSTAQLFLETQEKERFECHLIEGAEENTALVFSQENKRGIERVQKVLDEMEKEGVLEVLKVKWHLQ